MVMGWECKKTPERKKQGIKLIKLFSCQSTISFVFTVTGYNDYNKVKFYYKKSCPTDSFFTFNLLCFLFLHYKMHLYFLSFR